MNNIGDDRGRYLALPGSRTFHRIPSVQAVAVVSGNLLRELTEVDRFCLELRAETVEAAAGELFRLMEKDDLLLQAIAPEVYRRNRLGYLDPPHVLVVGGRSRELLRVIVQNPRTVQSISWPEPAFGAIGAWIPFLDATGVVVQQPPPPNLEVCLSAVSTWARNYITSIYSGRSLDRMIAEGQNPTVGYPLHAITFDADGTVREYEVSESEVFEVEEVTE